jgi:hypothetical protein
VVVVVGGEQKKGVVMLMTYSPILTDRSHIYMRCYGSHAQRDGSGGLDPSTESDKTVFRNCIDLNRIETTYQLVEVNQEPTVDACFHIFSSHLFCAQTNA